MLRRQQDRRVRMSERRTSYGFLAQFDTQLPMVELAFPPVMCILDATRSECLCAYILALVQRLH